MACWGFNVTGQLGDGTTRPSRAPVQVGLLVPALEIRAGDYHTCARIEGGAVACWGENTPGSLGDGTRLDRLSPALVQGLPRVARIAAAGLSTCALDEDGGLRCWGRFGEIVDGHPAPALVTALAPAL